MKVLWLKTELLHPVDKGGKIRTYHMLKELKKEHEITYLTLDDGAAEPDARKKADEYCNELITVPHRTARKFSGRFYAELASNAVSRLPYALEKYVSSGMRQAIEAVAAQKEHDVLVCDFLAPAVNLPESLSIPTVLFQHNVEAMIWRRHFEVAENPLKRRFLKTQWQRMFEYERRACHRFDHVIAVSREDCETMRGDYGADRIADVPTGVDTDYFRTDPSVPRDGCQVVFTGSMDWMPNEDGINWFAETIWPLVRERVGNASLVVVGRNPSSALTQLSIVDPSITVTGRVDDVRPYLSGADVFVVPIRVGGGTRLKIFEAMAMGLPVVSTTIGAEGLPLTDNEEILVRDDPADFADVVVELLSDSSLAGQLGSTGEQHVREDFGWARVAALFADQCRAVVLDHTNRANGDTVPMAAISRAAGR